MSTSSPSLTLPYPVERQKQRKASGKDRLRVTRISELVAGGLTLPDATWRVLGEDATLAWASLQHGPRPSDASLLNKWELLARSVAPAAVEAARNQALAVIAGASPKAAQLVAGLATGERPIDDPKAEAVRLNAAGRVLDSIGAGVSRDQGRASGPVQVTVNVLAKLDRFDT